MVIDCSDMCKEATLAFAGHYFIQAFAMASACTDYAALTGQSNSFYTSSDEKKAIEQIKHFKKCSKTALHALEDIHESFIKDLKNVTLPRVLETLKSATESHALKRPEWCDLLKWWFDAVNAEIAAEK